MRLRPVIPILGALAIVTGCNGAAASVSESVAPVTTTPTSVTSTTTPTTTSSTTTTTTSTTSTTTTSTTTTTTTTVAPLPDPTMANANEAFDRLASANTAVTMTVVRDGRTVLGRASGTTIDGGAATSDSPMVVASVSKLLTALMISRLDAAGALDVDAPTPWADMGVATHPGWADVTPAELLSHTSGMPVMRQDWFDGGIDCATFLPALLAGPPTGTRGRWTYSNGNYCALGLMVTTATGLPLDAALQALVFDPLGLTGAHLTTGGQQPTDVASRPGVERLSRLGGAGSFLVSTDDLARTFADVTSTDLRLLAWPGVMIDQYGWGHTGSVDDAAACLWVLEDGRTVVAATVAGGFPSTGGLVCDRVVPAVANDLDIGRGAPDRSPP